MSTDDDRLMCPICGEVFSPHSAASRYCSARCRESAKYRRSKNGRSQLPREVNDLDDAISRLRFVEEDFARLAVSSNPHVAAVCHRFSAAIASILKAEGVL